MNDSIKEAIKTSLQELSRAVEDMTFFMSLIHKDAKNPPNVQKKKCFNFK